MRAGSKLAGRVVTVGPARVASEGATTRISADVGGAEVYFDSSEVALEGPPEVFASHSCRGHAAALEAADDRAARSRVARRRPGDPRHLGRLVADAGDPALTAAMWRLVGRAYDPFEDRARRVREREARALL